jgi:hypothetical protein
MVKLDARLLFFEGLVVCLLLWKSGANSKIKKNLESEAKYMKIVFFLLSRS